MVFNRTENAKRIIVWGIIQKIVSLIMPFIMRTIMLHILGSLYTGLNSLFSSILNAVNLAELGIGSALVFSMYSPVANDDKVKICALLRVYKIAYLLIGVFVTIVGCVLIPFLPSLIVGDYPTDIDIYIIYIIQLASTSFGYFFMAYKTSVLNAYQRTDVINRVTLCTEIGMYLLQIFSLVVLKNYYLFVFATLLRQVLFNLVLGFYVDKKYPEIRAKGNVSKEEQKLILKKTGALMGHKTAAVVINSIDNIFISAFIGLEMVTFYNNYSFVVTAVSGLFLILTNGLNSIVGNYLLTMGKKQTLKLFNTLHYLISFAICFCCCCFVSMFQPFMVIWVGKESLLSATTVILFATSFFSIKIRTIGVLFKDSAGLWEKDVIKSYAMILIDLLIDIFLLKTIGIDGALISTIVSMMFAFFYETHVLFKYCLYDKPYRYYANSLLYLIATIISCTVSYIVCAFLPVNNLWAKLMLCLLSSGLSAFLCFVAFTFWSKEFKNSVAFVKEKIVRR